MLTRVATVMLLIFALCFIGFPSYSKPERAGSKSGKTSTPALTQDPDLTISTTNANQPGGGTVTNLTGRYQSSGRTVNLRSVTVKTVKNVIPGPPPPDSPAQEEGYQPDADYYHSDSEMTTSDGNLLFEAVYNYNQPTGSSLLTITIGGVTLTFDLMTGEPGPFSDADAEKLNNWLMTNDGRLVQDASVAVIDSGYQQADPEYLQNYYAVAMLVDTNPSPEARSDRNGSDRLHTSLARLHHKLENGARSQRHATELTVWDRLSLNSSPTSVQSNCYCCGWGCHCIVDRGGARIYHNYCLQHDSCSGQYGRLGRPCLYSLAGSILVVWYRIR